MSDPSPATHRQPVGKMVRNLLLVVAGMFGFGYLMVPLYDVLCDVTGLNGKTGVVTAGEVQAAGADLSREITVEFIANLNQGARWDFKPRVVRMQAHPGKLYTTSYIARNRSDHDVVGQAVPSVAPREASTYFNKTECFCFSRQKFMAQESRDMPLTFVIDPNLPPSITTVTLSYTFFDIGQQEQS